MLHPAIAYSGQIPIVLALFTVLAAACNPPLGAPTVPEDVVTPTTIGIISTSEQRDDGRLVTLRDGSGLLIPIGATDLTGPAADGRLLIMGEGSPAAPEGGVWYAAVRALPSGCFDLPANGEVRGDRMALSLGFSLPLNDEWDETTETFVETPVVGFCLDAEGTVVRPYSES